MEANNNQPIVLLRKIFVSSFVVFVLVIIAGICLGIGHAHHVHTIVAGCGYHKNCILLYSKHHMGMTVWWLTVFTTGMVGTILSLIALVAILVSGRAKKT